MTRTGEHTVTTRCDRCGSIHAWSWEHAFDKFGFDDGDGLVMTGHVVEVLAAAGYAVTDTKWGCHNVIICDLRLDGVSQIPTDAKLGYDDPRGYLPDAVIALLDASFPDGAEVQP